LNPLFAKNKPSAKICISCYALLAAARHVRKASEYLTGLD
jgi:hypothetical protein